MSEVLFDLLRDAADADPDRMALVDGEEAFSYGELFDRAGAIAATLQRTGIQPGDRVALWLTKSHHAVAAIYGVLGAGAVYVPVDPRAPTDRVAYIADHCGARAVILTGDRVGQWSEIAPRVPEVRHLLVVARELGDGVAPVATTVTLPGELAGAGEGRPVATEPDDPAYILYTSGSTGQPKGVTLSNRNGSSFVRWAVKALGIQADDRLSSHAPFHFDLSILDLYAASAARAAVVLVPKRASLFPVELIDFIDREGLTVWYSVPSVLSMLVERGGLTVGSLPGLRQVLFAGEVFPSRYLSQLMRLVPQARYWNLFGPTETNVCTAYEVLEPPGATAPPVAIGRAIEGVETVVVDDVDAPVAGGEVGELLVAGPTVTAGYWADRERTERALVKRDFGSGERCWYRTGDLVSQGDSGDHTFVGRRDHQVKSRGYRIELGEIEAGLMRIAEVEQAAAIAVPDPLVTNRIVAFVTTGVPMVPSELSAALGQLLPPHLIPDRFTVLDSLPQTSTGKTDRQALSALTAARE